jgi:choline dehydrogenase-like flavoprotein
MTAGARSGLTGWGWSDVLPYFLKHEDHIAPQGDHHRSGGEYRVEHPRVRWDVLDAIREAGEEAGVAKHRRFQQRRQCRLVLFPGQPARGPSLEHRHGLPQAGPEAR